MKVEVKKLNKLKRKIKVEIGGEEFLKERNEAFRQSSKNLKVPGFRAGYAPLDVIEKHHGAFLRDEFLQKTLPQFYQRALKENKILPASLPRIYDVDFKPGSLEFCAEFEVKPQPEVSKSNYNGIKIKDTKCEVKEIEIEKILTNLKEGIKKVVNKDLGDEELAKWSSYADVKTFREVIKGQLFFEKLRERRQKIEAHIKGHLLKAVEIDLPQGEIDRQLEALVSREVYNLQSRGVSEEDIDKYQKDLKERLRPQAGDDLKLFYILEAIAREEGIKIDNNLVDVVMGFILSQANYQK